MSAEKPKTAIEAMHTLALFAANNLKTPELVREHARLCAEYVDAAVRESGGSQSIFDQIFGKHRL